MNSTIISLPLSVSSSVCHSYPGFLSWTLQLVPDCAETTDSPREEATQQKLPLKIEWSNFEPALPKCNQKKKKTSCPSSLPSASGVFLFTVVAAVGFIDQLPCQEPAASDPGRGQVHAASFCPQV